MGGVQDLTNFTSSPGDGYVQPRLGLLGGGWPEAEKTSVGLVNLGAR